ncbi:MAG: 4-(cytidine 5'-diphospho)-2-C-methyl-D-erythritol kinase [Planctomycetota bacterium]
MHDVAVAPPAKLNLFLEIHGRREDGFHEIDTVMVPVDWCDELRLRGRSHCGIDLTVHSRDDDSSIRVGEPRSEIETIPSDDRNLVHRALTRFNEEVGWSGGWEVHLRKSIPSGAGMGGASSDAASAIRAAAAWLNRFQPPFSDPNWLTSPRNAAMQLEIAASLGSDVPFFLRPGSAGRATGRGEVITDVPLQERLHFVIMYPPESVSTAEIYGRLGFERGQLAGRDHVIDSVNAINAIASGKPERIGNHLHNRMQPAACGLSSRIEEALQCFKLVGLTSAMMTGSGSACFALVPSASQASAGARDLASMAAGRERLQGALIRPASSCDVPSVVSIA